MFWALMAAGLSRSVVVENPYHCAPDGGVFAFKKSCAGRGVSLPPQLNRSLTAMARVRSGGRGLVRRGTGTARTSWSEITHLDDRLF